MTMHLAHPALTTLGKRKGKQKFASSEQKQKLQLLQQDWERKQQEWLKMSNPALVNKKSTPSRKLPNLSVPANRSTKHIPSIDTGIKGAVNIKQPMQYTGDKIIGIGTMHKSNAVPIFNDEAAKDISKMRR